MAMMLTRIVVLGAGLALAAPALAQRNAGGNTTYRCVDAHGKKYYSSTIPRQCIGRPVEQLNAQGLVVRRIDPEGDDKAQAEKEAALAKKRAEEVAEREERRRNQALLATYTSEKDIDEARARALAENRKAMLDVQTRIDIARKRRSGYDKELEFYKGATKPPAKLADDIQNAEVEIKANEELLAVKKKEVAQINARYDEDKKRYRELTGRK
jgi:hypothetical protein